jgi:hypothetical protein
MVERSIAAYASDIWSVSPGKESLSDCDQLLVGQTFSVTSAKFLK